MTDACTAHLATSDDLLHAPPHDGDAFGNRHAIIPLTQITSQCRLYLAGSRGSNGKSYIMSNKILVLYNALLCTIQDDHQMSI